ncbi:uncharacterized protein V1518DRAFT_14663 [Limtongia smithiae]|uniref:uncharacterized protein n=1 Tax=Limtongia smithiae TaxID=1125753 RepID=UPI0034CFAF43
MPSMTKLLAMTGTIQWLFAVEVHPNRTSDACNRGNANKATWNTVSGAAPLNNFGSIQNFGAKPYIAKAMTTPIRMPKNTSKNEYITEYTRAVYEFKKKSSRLEKWASKWLN